MKLSDLNWGLPAPEILKSYRIWDSYFTPSHGHPGKDGFSAIVADLEHSKRAIALGQIEKLCFFPHVGLGTTGNAAVETLLRQQPDLVMRLFELLPNKLLGMIQLNANRLDESRGAIDRWLVKDPLVGVYFPGGGSAALTCTHPNFVPLVERIAERKGLIMQHTWNKTGGKGGAGESTPAELAVLAAKFPEQVFIAAHAGGEWEQGLRAVRGSPNVWVETSGFDATAGFLEMAVREIGEDRILFGSHVPSRSLGTELTKVTAAEISEEAKGKILGGNFRRLLGV